MISERVAAAISDLFVCFLFTSVSATVRDDEVFFFWYSSCVA